VAELVRLKARVVMARGSEVKGCVAPTALGDFLLFIQPLRAGLTSSAPTALVLWWHEGLWWRFARAIVLGHATPTFFAPRFEP
jgi:hypothetical protein